jgi:hypothetical protein
LLPVLLLAAAACSDGGGGTGAKAPRAVDPDAWWTAATQRPGGAERILAPRELRALLAEGRALGADRDAEWWAPRATWAYQRILTLDPDDIEANRGSGRRTLQSLPGFEETWAKLVEVTIPSPEIEALLDRFGPDVEEKRPIFLYPSECPDIEAQLKAAARHVARLEEDPGYAATVRTVAFVKSSHLSDFPHVHVRFGPFLLFFAAHDLRRIPGETGAAEDRRLADLRRTYEERLEGWKGAYLDTLAELEKLFPDAAKAHGLAPGDLVPQWISNDAEAYNEVKYRLRRTAPDPAYRKGFFHEETGWAYLQVPEDLDKFAETAAYLAARQVLRLWARDAKNVLVNHFDRGGDVWLLEGLPAHLAAKRVRNPVVGGSLPGAREAGVPLPEVATVVERRSRIEPFAYPEVVYTDVAWRLASYLVADERRASLERYLLGRLDGSQLGFEWFEKCFEVKDWTAFQRAVYEGNG